MYVCAHVCRGVATTELFFLSHPPRRPEMEDVRQNDAFISHTRRCPAGVALASEIYNELTHVHGKKVWLDVKAPNDDPSVHA